MKEIRIKFVDFDGFGDVLDPEKNLILTLLKKHYTVVMAEENPDYIFCSLFHNGRYYLNGIYEDFCKYPQIRIFVEGENYVPDFNLVDYAICAYPVQFNDRSFYIPGGVEALYRAGFSHFIDLPLGRRTFSKADLVKKDLFANFISGHDSEYNKRSIFFKLLSEYKRVDSPGKLLNNTSDNKQLTWWTDSKTDYQSRSKFTICFESTKSEGFITEKIIDAFYSNTVPVYYGSANVSTIFNPKAFINCNDYDSFDQVVERIKSLDNNDEDYMEMMRQPIFVENDYKEKLLTGLENFLCNIFDQPIENAYRRSRVYLPKLHEDYIEEAQKIMLPRINRKWNAIKRKNQIKSFIKRRIPWMK